MNVNLISDTVTKPTQGMMEAMFNAHVGDDVFKEDPTVNELEEKVANLFGMGKSIIFPIRNYDKSDSNKNFNKSRRSAYL